MEKIEMKIYRSNKPVQRLIGFALNDVLRIQKGEINLAPRTEKLLRQALELLDKQ